MGAFRNGQRKHGTLKKHRCDWRKRLRIRVTGAIGSRQQPKPVRVVTHSRPEVAVHQGVRASRCGRCQDKCGQKANMSKCMHARFSISKWSYTPCAEVGHEIDQAWVK